MTNDMLFKLISLLITIIEASDRDNETLVRQSAIYAMKILLGEYNYE